MFVFSIRHKQSNKKIKLLLKTIKDYTTTGEMTISYDREQRKFM